MKLRKNEQGFSVVEVLLVLIFLAIVFFIGFYVAHAQKDKTNDAQTTAATAPAAKTATNTDTQSNSTKYLTIGEWGVKIPVSGTLATATYQDISAAYGTDTMVFRVDSSVPQTCKGGSIGELHRDTTSPGFETPHMGSYYYYYTTGQDCDPNYAAGGVMMDLKQAVAHIVSAN